MKFEEILGNAWRKTRSALRWPGLASLVRAPLGGGPRTLLKAWWGRSRQAESSDVTHRFHARDYPGSRARRYLVHLPRGRVGRNPRPLLLVLHGCRQDHRDIEAITGFNRLADRHGFLVAYPFVTGYRGLRNRNCWGWWFDREIHAGAGEVEDLWQIVEEIRQRYLVDERRIHVTGLSSGAGMAVAMMVAHADKIASGAAVAGVPYAEHSTAVRHAFNPNPRSRPVTAIAEAMRAEMGDAARTVPIQVVHSVDDDKVPVRSAEVLRDSWGLCFGIDTRSSARTRRGRNGATAWSHSRYRDAGGRVLIETLFLEGPGHGWYGGNLGEFSYPDGPDIARWIWRFCEAHPLDEAGPWQNPVFDRAV